MGYGGLGIYQRFVRPFIKYNPEKYWLKRGKKFHKEGLYNSEFYRDQETKLLNFLRELQFETVLEFGCGFGRISKLILDNFPLKKYQAFDLSPDNIENAKKMCEKFPHANFEVKKIEDFKSNESFDLVIGTETLMHVFPSDIDRLVSKLVGFAKLQMVNLDLYQIVPPEDRIPNPHDFFHSYPEIYKKIPKVSSFKRIKVNELQSIFLARIK